MPTAAKNRPADQYAMDLGTGELVLAEPAKALAVTPAQTARENKHNGWAWVDGLLYREQAALKPRGDVPGLPGVTYTHLSGVDGISSLIELLRQIAARRSYFALDYETGPRMVAPVDPDTGEFDLSQLTYSTERDPNKASYGSDPHTSVVFLMALSVKKDHAFVVDVREAQRLGGDRFAEALAGAITEGGMIAHNAQFELLFSCRLTRCPKHPDGVFGRVGFDTMIASRLCYAGLPDPGSLWTNPAKPPQFGADMESVLAREMGLHLDKKWQKFFLHMHPESGLVDAQLAYVAGDTAKLFELSNILSAKLVEQKLFHLWTDFEQPFIPIVARAIWKGVPIDLPLLIKYRAEAEAEVKPLLEEWNRRFPKIAYTEVAKAVEMFRLRYPGSEITGGDEKNLSLLVENHKDDDARLLLELRSVTKVLSTYINPWIMETRNPMTGRIHCGLNQCDTATGRMNSRSPNLQNIPSRSKWRKIRQVFRARDGYKIVDRDLSQFEVRALADMAGETHLLDLYVRDQANNVRIAEFVALHPEVAPFVAEEKWAKATAACPDFRPMWEEKTACDVHILNAMATWPEEWATAGEEERVLMRKKVKPVTFAVPYGGGARTVSEAAGIAMSEAKRIVTVYKQVNPNNWAYLEGQARNAMFKRVVYSSTGRPRYFPEIPASFDEEDRERILAGNGREGMNHPIQSVNADVIKMASILMAPYLYERGAEFALWVHDEVMTETPDAHTDDVAAHMAVCMKEAARLCNLLRVPVETSCETGQAWSH